MEVTFSLAAPFASAAGVMPGSDTETGDWTPLLSETSQENVASFDSTTMPAAGCTGEPSCWTETSIEGGVLSTSKVDTADEVWPTASEASTLMLCMPSARPELSRLMSNASWPPAAAARRCGASPSIEYVEPAGFA